LLSEASIAAICDYEEEFKAIYVAYLSENYTKDTLLLVWKEIAL